MNRLIVGLIVAVTAFAMPALANDTAYDYTSCFHGRVLLHEKTPPISVSGVEYWGIARSDGASKAFDQSTAHCVAYAEYGGKKSGGGGVCELLDRDGDVAVIRSQAAPGGGWQITFLSGTGKYKGIHGGGTSKRVAHGKATAPGTFDFCVRSVGSYSVP